MACVTYEIYEPPGIIHLNVDIKDEGRVLELMDNAYYSWHTDDVCEPIGDYILSEIKKAGVVFDDITDMMERTLTFANVLDVLDSFTLETFDNDYITGWNAAVNTIKEYFYRK